MPENRDKNKKLKNIPDKAVYVLGLVWTLLYGAMCFYLYHMQAIHIGRGDFESDLSLHVSMALDGWGYSITAWIYRILCSIPGQNYTIPFFLVLATIATIILTFLYYKHQDVPNAISFLCAFAGTFVMPFFIKAIHYQRYIGYQSATIWHNSTYIVMKPLAFAAFLLYLRIAKEYGRRKCLKEAIIFAVLLALTTGVKTSFIFVFAPAAFLFLFADLLAGYNWKKVLPMAVTVIPALAIILMQELVLFGKETGNAIIIDFGYTVYYRAEKPYFTMILSALFPVLIFLVNIIPVLKETFYDFKDKKGELTHRSFLLSWTMWVFGALELLFLRETGARELDGNFSWGYDFCLFVLFIVSILYFIRNLKSERFLKGKVWAKALYGALMGGILGYHVYCGIYFFMELLKGTTYFM